MSKSEIDEESRAAPRRSVAVASVTLVIVIVLFLTELAFALRTFVLTERLFPTFDAETGNSFVENSNPECYPYTELLQAHPYLGFVRDIQRSDCYSGVWAVNSFGLPDSDVPPSGSNPVSNSVLLLGGSVAAQLGASKYLENELTKCLPGTWQVFTAADGAWKQPQQLIAQSLFGGGVGHVFSLEGFNEHYSLNSSRIDFAVPASNFSAVAFPRPWYTELATQAVRWAESVISSVPLLDRSQALGTLIQAGRTYVQRVDSQELFETASRQWIHGGEQSTENRLSEYARYLKLMGSSGRAMNQSVHVFIQPVPAIGKVLTDDEVAVVGDLSYRHLYQHMTNSLTSQSLESTNVHSLLHIFRNSDETLYSDPIHFHMNSETGESRGYEMISVEMVKRFATAEGLPTRCG